MSELAKKPEPPYYAVIFTSRRTPGDNCYLEMANEMVELAKLQPGFLGMVSARDAGREQWYQSFATKVCRVERAYDFVGE